MPLQQRASTAAERPRNNTPVGFLDPMHIMHINVTSYRQHTEGEVDRPFVAGVRGPSSRYVYSYRERSCPEQKGSDVLSS